ncbi:MAG TPA: hypothetical protein VEQ60_32550 [Longimicrobium sp.]|nr:hypothetical protein [Longimicrobium sp.]
MAMVVIPLGLGACERAALAPHEPPVAEVNVPVSMKLSSERMLALSAAVADARLRILPAISGDAPSALGAALQRLDEGLAADDPAALNDAVTASEAALQALPAEEVEAVLVEVDAILLLLGELRISAGSAAIVEP